MHKNFINVYIKFNIYLPIGLFIHPSIHTYIYLSSYHLPTTYLPTYYLSIYLSVCLSIYLSICLSVCLSIYLFVSLSVCLTQWRTVLLDKLVFPQLVKVPCILPNPKGHTLFKGHCSKPAQSTTRPPILKHHLQHHPPTIMSPKQTAPSGFPSKTLGFSSFPCVLHVPPITFSLNRSSCFLQRSTEQKASHYAVFSLLLFPST